MSTLIYILFVIVSVILTLVVLIQDEQGEGLGGIFGGGSSTPFGSRSGNVLTRFTTYTAIIFFVVILVLALLNRSPISGNPEALAEQRQLEQDIFQREESGTEILWDEEGGDGADIPEESNENNNGETDSLPASDVE